MRVPYLVFVWSDVEPEIKGPFANEGARTRAARKLRRESGEEHGIYPLDIVDGIPEIGSYSGRFFDGC